MTPDRFVATAIDYFGEYPKDKPGVLTAVSEYLATKSEAFLGALWPIVRDSRPAGYGPPDMAALMEHADRAAEYARTHHASLPPSRPMLEDNEPRATAEEVAQIVAPLAEKKKAEAPESEYYKLTRPKRFAHLDGVRIDAKITLGPEWYDEQGRLKAPWNERKEKHER